MVCVFVVDLCICVGDHIGGGFVCGKVCMYVCIMNRCGLYYVVVVCVVYVYYLETSELVIDGIMVCYV